MKSKLQWLDLMVCTLWFIGVLANHPWLDPLILLSVFLRVVMSFSLYNKEKRTWMPLFAFTACLGMLCYLEIPDRTGGLVPYYFTILGVEDNSIVKVLLEGLMFVWIVIAPYIYYIVMLLRHKLEKTDLKKKDIFGAILWNDRRARYFSVFFLITVTSLLAGLAMYSRMCMLMCLTLPAVSYWLVCRYYGVKAKNVWLVVMAMLFFWYSQPLGGIYRIATLAISFCLVAYVCFNIYKKTKQYLLTGICIIYLAVLLPSFSMGYNQYACINYPRNGYATLVPYHGIFYIKDSTNGDLEGLRDRYGLLVKPEYDHILAGDPSKKDMFDYCRLRKDGYTQTYDIWNNRILPSDRNAELQANLCNIIKDYYSYIPEAFERGDDSNAEEDYGDCGEIKVTDLSRNKVIGLANIVMFGNPFFEYEGESLLPKDSIEIITNAYLFNDSVWIQEAEEYGYYKNILTYSQNIPNDSCPRYNVRIRLAKESRPSEEDVQSIMARVRRLKFFNKSSKR